MHLSCVLIIARGHRAPDKLHRSPVDRAGITLQCVMHCLPKRGGILHLRCRECGGEAKTDLRIWAGAGWPEKVR